jgi:THO complex subunit 2
MIFIVQVDVQVTLLYQGSEDTTENTSAATIGIIKVLT